jgi:phosphatidylserine/phosphatidylglycerophosphate/cardiolipin synthase-like enzyme
VGLAVKLARLAPLLLATALGTLGVGSSLGATGCSSAASEDDAASSEAAQTERRSSALARHGSGTWQVPATTDDERRWPMVHAWVDASVANVRRDKRVFVEVRAAYEGGAVVRTLWPAWHRGGLDNNRERWGSDAIEIFPNGGPNGARLEGAVAFRLRMQHDETGRGDEMVVTEWERLYGDGALPSSTDDPFSTGLTSPVSAQVPAAAPEVHFSPYEDTALSALREIDAVTAAKQADRAGRHTIHAAIFNVNDPRIVDALIRAHRAGVEVRLAVDAKKLRPTATWMTGDDALLAAGVPVIGIGHPDRGAMHLKLAVFDGKKVETGSFNWETGSSTENHENMILLSDRELALAYAEQFEALVGGVARKERHASRIDEPSSAFFGPNVKLHEVMGDLIDRATKSVHVAMFTAKRDGEGGALTRLFEKLIAARRRGVDVIVMFDSHIAEPFNFHGQQSGDDQTDEWLESSGVHVIRADNRTSEFASMHHKYMVVDGKITVTGAFNWYWDAAFINDEDVVILRDPSVAAQYTGELTDLSRRYDPAFDARAWKATRVDFEATVPNTALGDSVVVAGDLSQAGGWDLSRAIVLDGASFPKWKGSVTLPAGVRLEYKLVVRRADGGSQWESGGNRRVASPSDGSATKRTEVEFRR